MAGQLISVKGPKGQLEQRVPLGISISQEGNSLTIARGSASKQGGADHGLARALTANMVKGVSVGFEKRLEIHGIGYKAEVKGSTLHLGLGYSHPIAFAIPQGVTITVEGSSPQKLSVKGIDKQQVGQAAATIRGFRPPDSYKGKGVRYAGEYVRIKAGKSAA